ncbi:hypothetical protein [Burkholderia orbicola]|uniref:hypothetical protein n=1 Tax=Burkholderia orbicola TaxID=2978683 RepID=UPI002FE01D85
MGLVPTPATRRKRVFVDGDFQFLAYMYFPYHIRGEPPLFQAHFCARFSKLLRQARGAREWWGAPHGEAGSSLTTKVDTTYIISQGLPQHAEICREVSLTSNPPVTIFTPR